jgi:putative Mn2+ efflux pump MntP
MMTLVLIGFSVAADAFAASLTLGTGEKLRKYKEALLVATIF